MEGSTVDTNLHKRQLTSPSQKFQNNKAIINSHIPSNKMR